MIANPVTLRPLFDADEGMKEVGGPAYLAQLTGSGAAVIGARDFAAQIYDLALLRALVGVGRDMVEGALDTSEEVAPLAQIERAETELYRVAEEGGAEGKVKSFGEATMASICRWPRRRSTAAAHLPASPPASTASTPRSAACTSPTWSSSPAVRAWARASLATNIGVRRRASGSCAIRRTGSSRRKAAGARSPSSAWKCRPTSSPPVSLPSNRGSVPKTCAWARSASRNSASSPAPPASLQSLPLYIDDTPGLTIAALRARARRLKRQKGIGMVVVDYLQLLQGTGKGSATTIASRKFRRSAAA